MRIIIIYAYVYFVKARLNITIEENILSSVKIYASKHQISLSELVENYFSTITKSTKGKNIIDIIENLKAPIIDDKADLSELFYKEQAGKYGF